MGAFKAATLLLVVAWVWLALSALADAPRVSLRSPGGIATAPADWWVLITIDPKPENRVLVIEADGEPGEYRRSDVELDGERAPRLRQVWFKRITTGCYYFSAEVYGSGGRLLGRATTPPLHVVGHGSDGDPCE